MKNYAVVIPIIWLALLLNMESETTPIGSYRNKGPAAEITSKTGNTEWDCGNALPKRLIAESEPTRRKYPLMEKRYLSIRSIKQVWLSRTHKLRS